MAGHQRQASARQLLAARIGRLRKQRGMTQQDLSAAAGITRSHISAIEHGRCNMRLDSLDSIARALGVSLQQLFDEAGPDESERAPRLPPRIGETVGRYRVPPPVPGQTPALRITIDGGVSQPGRIPA